VATTHPNAAPSNAACLLIFWRAPYGVLDSLEKGLRIKLGARDLVRAIREDGNSPVTDEGDELSMLRGLDLGTEMLCIWDTALSLDVNEYKIVVMALEHGESLRGTHRRVDVEARKAQNLVAKRSQHLPVHRRY
jgi:hypothetical protein